MRPPAFVLIHGHGHSGACWAPLVEALARRGAPAMAVDLPCDDPAAGLRDYADVVLARTALLEDVVVVGHSMGGLTAPVVAGERPVRDLVFLCAVIPAIGMSAMAQLKAEPDMQASWAREHPYELDLAEDGTYPPLGDHYVKECLYHDCPPQYQEWAISQLRRQAPLPLTEVSPLKQWPSVRMRAIYCEADRAMSLDWARRVLRDRFGMVPEEMPGGHCPFLTRPAELAALLLRPYTRPGRE